MKRYFLIILVIVLNLDLSFGDEPPSWRPYKVISQNKQYFCYIDFNDNDISNYSWNRKWVLKVYKKDSTLIWQKDYQPGGYQDGLLSDDGNKFVYIEYWYFNDAIVVNVIRKNQPEFSFKGQDFHIPGIFLQRTISHKLWLENYSLENDRLTICVRDGRVWLINLESGEKELIGFKFNVIHLIIGIIIILLITIAIIVIKRKKKK